MIKLSDIIKVDDPKRTKIKFHKNEWDTSRSAYDMLLDEEATWSRMNAWREKNNNHNLDKTKYLIAMAQYYPYGKEYYIFGGIYKVAEKHSEKYGVQGYKLKRIDKYFDYEKRLIIKVNRANKLSRSYLRWYKNAEKNLDMEIYEIAPNTKLGTFTGYQNVSLPHNDLVRLINNEEPSYKQALLNVKGIYVVTDISNGKLYIGSASGNSEGIWQRWSCYANFKNPTGDNEEFKNIFVNDKEHIQKNFKYSILEIFDPKTNKEKIGERENYWKKVFETRRFGMNDN